MNRFIFFISMLIWFGISCADSPKGISAADRVVIDSLFNVEKDLIQVELDSLCNLKRERLFKQSVDSISRQRIAEINQIIN